MNTAFCDIPQNILSCGVVLSIWRPNPYVGLGPYNEKSNNAIYRIEVAKIVISTVEYVMVPDAYENKVLPYSYILTGVIFTNRHFCFDTVEHT